MFQGFPKWKYHRTLPACIVNDATAEAELGEDWADSPAAFLGQSAPEPESPAAPVGAKPEKKTGRKKGA